ncbi:hypothetical protein [Streptomyces griseomycini]|uniref:Uncharacterized protein n=1 Tax=Streptomyces griseomycini TaxID=66895 RepID=A0A7W7M1J6_9ACTN|nr:hypothetical protein [Streptomyces griseomycini]MBB4900384.1 hypothetical protein [Streptomyces griseomycini]GGQ24679.1 hypothetical protein GCM10010266_54890 [Streptomyces griseomycini]GGR38804.1 hypothetical protein GCM10015536_50720 [Streptomyces griseomycini]
MRRIATVTFGGLALLGLLTTPAGAVPDPVAAVTCITGSATEVTALVDPAALTAPGELPAITCLAP